MSATLNRVELIGRFGRVGELRRTSSAYLKNNDPSSFVIAYTDPPEVTPEVDRVRVFIKAGENRMPVPVAVARDATQEGAWRLTMISL